MLSALIEKMKTEVKADAARRGAGVETVFGKAPALDRNQQGGADRKIRLIWDGTVKQEPIYHPRTLKPVAKESQQRYLSGDSTTVLLTADEAAKERKRRGWN